MEKVFNRLEESATILHLNTVGGPVQESVKEFMYAIGLYHVEVSIQLK
jgi:hypothetical protein